MIVMAILHCQCDYIWNELQSRNGKQTCDLLGWKWVNPLLVQIFEGVRHMPLIRNLRTDLLLELKDMKEGNFFSLPSGSHFASTPITSLALKSTSLGFQHILKTSLDIQPCGTEQLLHSWTSHSQ